MCNLHGSAPHPLRSPGRGGWGWRRVTAIALGTLLLHTSLLVAACGSTGGGDAAGRQLAFGVSMAQQGLWSEALFRFERAHRLDPSSFRVLNNLAVAYEANGRFDEALATYRRALQLDPANRDLRRNYARFVEFYQSFRPEEAAGVEGGAAANPPAEPAAEPVPPPPASPAGAAAIAPDGESGAETDRGPGKDFIP